jgi:hypothetical protein
MPKESYIKPEIKSEVLEPGALAIERVSGGKLGAYWGVFDPVFGLCCAG